jgi:hypothetical protein
VVDIWNSLPEELIVAKTVKDFEIGLDNHWKHQELSYVVVNLSLFVVICTAVRVSCFAIKLLLL